MEKNTSIMMWQRLDPNTVNKGLAFMRNMHKQFALILDKLPYSIRVLLESAVRNCDNFHVTEQDVDKILNWEDNQKVEGGVEIAFKPARVILQVSLH